ncbi:MAG: hypothetical protein ACKVP4_01615 [Hyphomicrobium sp.]
MLKFDLPDAVFSEKMRRRSGSGRVAMKAKVLAVLAIVGAALSFLAVELAQHFGFIAGEQLYKGWRNAEIEQRYREVAADLNQKVPMQADEITRLDSVQAADMTVTYNYTMLQVPPASEIETLRGNMIQKAKDNYCGTTVRFRDDGVGVAMTYVDANGNSIFALRIAPEDC